MTNYLRPLSLLAVIVTLSIEAHAASFYASSRDNLYLIDTDAQTTTLVGSLGTLGPEIQLTPDEATILLPDRSGNLLSFDSATAASTGSVAINFPSNPPNMNTATALEYVGSTLYASFDQAGPESDPGLLGTLDPATGATTAIGTLTGMNAPSGGFAYDGGTMYAVSSANSEFSELYTINLGTGAATKIANITFGGAQVEAMTALVIVDGVAYTKSNDTTGGVDQQMLYSLDLATGQLTEVFDTGQDLVAFTSAPPVPAAPPASTTPVPTISAYGLVLTMLGLLLIAGRRLRAVVKS
ncbi:MAG: hypothetical protein KDI14_01675 [Halioglobus sp.]|nr:hypothetical protein [Halioglobus sp.]